MFDRRNGVKLVVSGVRWVAIVGIGASTAGCVAGNESSPVSERQEDDGAAITAALANSPESPEPLNPDSSEATVGRLAGAVLPERSSIEDLLAEVGQRVLGRLESEKALVLSYASLVSSSSQLVRSWRAFESVKTRATWATRAKEATIGSLRLVTLMKWRGSKRVEKTLQTVARRQRLHLVPEPLSWDALLVQAGAATQSSVITPTSRITESFFTDLRSMETFVKSRVASPHGGRALESIRTHRALANGLREAEATCQVYASCSESFESMVRSLGPLLDSLPGWLLNGELGPGVDHRLLRVLGDRAEFVQVHTEVIERQLVLLRDRLGPAASSMLELTPEGEE